MVVLVVSVITMFSYLFILYGNLGMLLYINIFYFPDPFFVVHHQQVKIHTSEVFEGAKKGDKYIPMEQKKPVPVCDDILIEFFNKPKMTRKVIAWCH